MNNWFIALDVENLVYVVKAVASESLRGLVVFALHIDGFGGFLALEVFAKLEGFDRAARRALKDFADRVDRRHRVLLLKGLWRLAEGLPVGLKAAGWAAFSENFVIPEKANASVSKHHANTNEASNSAKTVEIVREFHEVPLKLVNKTASTDVFSACYLATQTD